MVPNRIIWLHLLVLFTATFMCGCAQLANVRPDWFGQKEKELPKPMPTPAPPLYIPGPIPDQSQKSKTAQVQYEITEIPSLVPVTTVNAKKSTLAKSATSKILDIHQRAAEKIQKASQYRARLRRRETVLGKAKLDEVLMEQYRHKPASLAWQWLDGPHKNHRLIHIQNRDGTNAHWISPQPSFPLFKKSRHAKIPLDDPKLKQLSRFSIQKSGLAQWVGRYGRHINAYVNRDPNCGEFYHLGELKRPEFFDKVEAVMHKLPPGCDPSLTNGGQRLWFFDRKHWVPVLIISHDDSGRETGYYCYDRLQWDGPSNAGAFNPPTEE